jgi:peroxiredoxin Q/BCP
MTNRRSVLISSAIGGAGIFTLTQQPEVAYAGSSKSVLSLDTRAPDFELPNSRGQKISLDTFISAKKWTILYFFPGAFTSGCTLEARGFQRDLDEYRKLNSQIVGGECLSIAQS